MGEGGLLWEEIVANRVLAAPPWCTVVLGEAPSRSSDMWEPLLSGRSGRLLCQLAALEPRQAAFLFRFANLLPVVPSGPRPKAAVVRRAGERLWPHLRGRRVVTLGRLVSAAVGADGPLLEWREQHGFEALPLPHPSGRNRFWTGPGKAQVARLLLEEASRAAEGAILDLPHPGALPWLAAVARRDTVGA